MVTAQYDEFTTPQEKVPLQQVAVNDDSRYLLAEIWKAIVARDRRGSPPPPPSVFASWRRGFGDRVIADAIADVAKANELEPRLVRQVLYRRAQASYMLTDELLGQLNG